MTKKFISAISGAEFPMHQMVKGQSLRSEIVDFIAKRHPNFSAEDNLSFSELSKFREEYVTEMLLSESGELSDLESKVIASLKNDTVLSEKLDDEIRQVSFG